VTRTTDALRKGLSERLRNLFDQHHVVVWWGPSGAFREVLEEVKPEDVRMVSGLSRPVTVVLAGLFPVHVPSPISPSIPRPQQ